MLINKSTLVIRKEKCVSHFGNANYLNKCSVNIMFCLVLFNVLKNIIIINMWIVVTLYVLLIFNIYTFNRNTFSDFYLSVLHLNMHFDTNKYIMLN